MYIQEIVHELSMVLKNLTEPFLIENNENQQLFIETDIFSLIVCVQYYSTYILNIITLLTLIIARDNDQTPDSLNISKFYLAKNSTVCRAGTKKATGPASIASPRCCTAGAGN